jgi:DNA-binding transcriptional LysR family regulator
MRKGKETATIEPRGRVYCMDGPTNIAGALAGLGLLFVPDFEVGHEVHAGSLVRLMPGWQLQETALHLVFPPRKHVLARVRAFADFVVARWTEPPWSCSAARKATSAAISVA